MNSKTFKKDNVKTKKELNLKEFDFGEEIGKGTFIKYSQLSGIKIINFML